MSRRRFAWVTSPTTLDTSAPKCFYDCFCARFSHKSAVSLMSLYPGSTENQSKSPSDHCNARNSCDPKTAGKQLLTRDE